MIEHPQFDEDFDLHALGALDREEALEIESHVKNCARCASKLAEARGRIALLAGVAPSEEPPLRVKQRLMARVGEASTPELKIQKKLRPTAIWLRPAIGWAVACAALVAAFVLGFGNYRLSRQIGKLKARVEAQQSTETRARAVLALLTAPSTQKITLTAAAEKPRPEGRVYYQANHGMLFYAEDLPLPPPGRTYQLWLVPTAGAPVSAGVFQPDKEGYASIVLPDLPPDTIAKAFAVTVEPAGGVPQPTGPKVLIGAS